MKRIAFVLPVLLLAACDAGPSDSETSYQAVVRAEIETNCLSCHVAGGIAPFALDDVDTVQSLAPAIVAAVEDGTMPPYGYDDTCRDTLDSLALSDATKAVFTDWRAAGYPIDDEADYVAPEVEPPPEVRDADLVLIPEEGYLPTGDLNDDYRCLVLPQEFPEDTFVIAQDIKPDRVDLVHHVIIFEVTPDALEELDTLEANEDGPGYTCFGDSGLDSGLVVGGWAPGPSQVSLGGDSALRIRAGSKLVMQVHYNTVEAVLDSGGAPDRSELHLWTLPAGEEPDKLTTLFPVAHGGLYIEAGDAESVQTRTQRIPVDSTVVGTSPHMHLLGREMHTRILRTDGSSDCVTRVNDWDFNWQRSYFYKEELQPTLDLHDSVEITCVYDNSAANQPVVDGEQIDPRNVTWGDGTFDEMCLNFLILETPYAGDGSGGMCGGFPGCLEGCDPDDPTCAVECMGSIGYPCLSCGLESILFSSCVQSECGGPLLAFNQCYQDRPAGVGFLDTMVDHCEDEWTAAAACVDPVLRAGTCSDDFAECPGLAP